MIAGVINQTICTAHYHLHKEVALTKYGVECQKGNWKAFMASYFLQLLDYDTCEEAYTIECAFNALNKNLVTAKVCFSPTAFTDMICSGTVTQLTTTVTSCSQASIQELN